MKNILDEIVAKRRSDVEQLKEVVPPSILEQMPFFRKQCLSIKESLLNPTLSGIIAEYKRASPSKGIINNNSTVTDVVSGYQANGAAGVSILTEPHYFKGNNDDIISVANDFNTPILRKEFTIDEYQILEAKAIGADVILLIAACLTPVEVKKLAAFAVSLGLEVLLELHDESELAHICPEVEIVGINNRNLKTFNVDIDHSLRMAQKIPVEKIKIAESGIDSIDTICIFKQAGFNGFLIGEQFMKAANPTIAFAEFVKEFKARLIAFE
jgi:indole-3-glycerol phosphate synthase